MDRIRGLGGPFFEVLRVRIHLANWLCSPRWFASLLCSGNAAPCCNRWADNVGLLAFEDLLPDLEGADAKEDHEEAINQGGHNEQEASTAKADGLEWLDDQDESNDPDHDRVRQRNALHDTQQKMRQQHGNDSA